ncbi:MAG: YfhO family protein [Oscillospiraceae bacterium]|jgi:uncharacterized membrane protein YfhO|nr:YfhO family protein [Oscillospiraceae bacterium]
MANTYLGKNSRLEGKIKGIFTRNAYCWLAFFAAAAIMMLVYICYHVIPFGNFTVLRMDLYHQYGPLFAELYDRVTGLKSLFYSWTSGMGGGFLGNFYNYVCSPLTLVTLLLGRDKILESISLIILLNAACSAAAFTYYLKRSRGVQNASGAAFGVLYAFCGWFIAYYWNIMWLDGMTLLPLVALGVELVVKERKSGWLMFALAMTLFSNYYMGYMAVLFAALYFLVYFFANYTLLDAIGSPRYRVSVGVLYTTAWDRLAQNRFLRTGVRFALTGFAAAGLVAFALLPVWYSLQTASATSGDFPQKSEFYNKIFDFFANHLAGLDPTIRSSGDDVLPNVYSGMAALLLVPLFLFAKKIRGREKLAYTLLLAALFFSMNINSLNYIWHGFHFPNDLPYRFSFIYSFVLLLVAFRAFQHVKEFTKAQIAGAGVAVVLWIVLVQEIGSKNLTNTTVWISLLFAFVYTVFFGLLRKDDGGNHFRARGLAALLLCIVCAEVTIASTDHYEINQKKEWFADDRPAFVNLKERLDEREGTEYYRMELSYLRARMDPCWFGYNGVSTFSSMAYEKTSNLEKRLGMFSNYINSYTYFPQTPVYNAMHALRYVVVNNAGDGRPTPNPLYYEAVDNEDKFHAYDNLYSLPVAFGTAVALEDWMPLDDYNPFSVQESWFSLATGEDDVFVPIPVSGMDFSNVNDIPYDEDSSSFSYYKQSADSSASAAVSYTVPNTQNLYIYAKSSEITTMTVKSSSLSMTYNPHDEYILDLGVCKKGEEISVEFSIPDGADKQNGGFNIRCYGLDNAVFETGYAKLERAKLNITTFTDTRIEGKVNMEQEGILFTSIPYDEGWHITVDGEPVQISPLCNALLTVPLSSGEHTVAMRYLPKGLLPGLLVTLLTAASVALWFVLEHLLRQRAEKKALLQSIPLYPPAPTPTETLEDMMFGIDEAAEYEDESIFPVDEIPPDLDSFLDAP